MLNFVKLVDENKKEKLNDFEFVKYLQEIESYSDIIIDFNLMDEHFRSNLNNKFIKKIKFNKF